MKRSFDRYFLLFLLFINVLVGTGPARAQSGITISDHGATIAFPEQVTFHASVSSNAAVQQVILEYGVKKHTCSPVIAQAFPAFSAGSATDVTWTWVMRKSGSEPPGAMLWYRWKVVDQSGATATSETQTILWLDQRHPWTQASTDQLALHWYAQSQAVASSLLTSASASLDRLIKMTGAQPEHPIDVYLYGDSASLQNAVLYAPGWTGGLAYPDYDLLLIGIPAGQVEWGKHALAHELTHVLIGTLTSGCFSNIPTWLNEGIAVYSEGGPSAVGQMQLTDAIQTNQLESIQVLSSPFSEDPGQANLAYSESYSLVNYLIATYDQAKLLALFSQLRQGTTIGSTFQQVYGYGLDELERRWRKSVGAAAAQPTPTTSSLAPTLIPTYQPADFKSFAASPPEAAQTNWPLLGGTGIGALILVAAMVYAIRRRRTNHATHLG